MVETLKATRFFLQASKASVADPRTIACTARMTLEFVMDDSRLRSMGVGRALLLARCLGPVDVLYCCLELTKEVRGRAEDLRCETQLP